MSIRPPRLIAIEIQRSAGGRSPERVRTVPSTRTLIGAFVVAGQLGGGDAARELDEEVAALDQLGVGQGGAEDQRDREDRQRQPSSPP